MLQGLSSGEAGEGVKSPALQSIVVPRLNAYSHISVNLRTLEVSILYLGTLRPPPGAELDV